MLPPVAIINPEWMNGPTIVLLLTTLLVQAIGVIVAQILKRQPETKIDIGLVRTFNRRISAWLTINAVLAIALCFPRVVPVVLFGLISFWALREFITMTPTRRGDHRALFWTFFVFTPLQYVFVGFGREFGAGEGNAGVDFYNVYSIMIPVYASLFLPARIAFTGDHKRFLERTAKIQFGLLICVYSLSYAPAILDMKDLQTWNSETKALEPWEGSKAGLLFFFMLMVQLSDMLQFLWDKLAGRHVIAPKINGSKTWEGLVGGSILTAIIGTFVHLLGVTPFTWHGAAVMALVTSIMGFAGTMTMSAIKRDRGVADYGTLVQGHAGILDRIDSVCFAAPVFFHVTRFFLEA